MKKGHLSKLLVKRISTSPYFSPDFFQLETETIESITGVEVLPLNSDTIANILITNTHTDTSQIPKAQLDACELMIHPNSGYDNLGAEFIKSAQFPVVIGNPIRAQAVVNFILSALFSHYSPIPNDHQWNQTRKWPRKLISELNILILGHGHIGATLNKTLLNLEAKVKVYDPYQGLDELNLRDVDVIIPACSLNSFNHHMIDKIFLNQVNDDFLLINAARGALVNTTDLTEVLKERPNAFAILDVFEKEPLDLSMFNNIKNINVSSHIAGVYKNIDFMTARFEAEVISNFKTMTLCDFEKKYTSEILKNRLTNDGYLI